MSFAFSSLGFSQDDDKAGAKPKGDIRLEFGIDSVERKFYRPEFSLSWPLGSGPNSRFFVDLSYYQRINGRLPGAIDFWLDIGLAKPLAAGYHFKPGYDLGLKLGINTTRQQAMNIGSEFHCRLDRERQAVEWILFIDVGRKIPLRPFIGVKKMVIEKAPSAHEPLKRQFIAGIAFSKWF